MGRFDGILICSDFDGTFSGGQDLSENINAVKYFTENGGRFTFATGRGGEFFREKEIFSLVNAPLCTYNGAVIYDVENWGVIKTVFTDLTIRKVLNSIEPKRHLLSEIYLFDGVESCFTSSTLYDADEGFLEHKVLKVVFTFEKDEFANEFQKFISNHETFKNCSVLKGWSTGVEVNSNMGTKGTAAHFVKDYLKNIHTIVGIGDYENDIPLVTDADLGVAVSNAVDAVKSAANKIIVPCKENAISYLIHNLL